MPRLALVAAISVVALLGVACRSVQLAGYQEVPRGFVGVYECEGFNSIGTPYRLTLSIGAVGATYQLVWSGRSGTAMQGLGLLMNDYLAVALVANGRPGVGVAMYRVTPGHLVGLWTGGGRVMPEMCERGAAASS